MEHAKIPRQFNFDRDRFAFANELVWEYQTDPKTGRMTFHSRDPKPAYTHRCFVLTRAARQFLYHARFDATQRIVGDDICRRLVRKVLARNPRKPCKIKDQIVIPGHASLREFSAVHESLLKTEAGGKWRSYVLRSHWRMIFPIYRSHQQHTATQLLAALRQDISPIIHLVKFPALTINHGMILFAAAETKNAVEFSAYDPNDPDQPTWLTYHRAKQTFSLPPNRYWPGGELDVIGIFRSWWL